MVLGSIGLYVYITLWRMFAVFELKTEALIGDYQKSIYFLKTVNFFLTI